MNKFKVSLFAVLLIGMVRCAANDAPTFDFYNKADKTVTVKMVPAIVPVGGQKVLPTREYTVTPKKHLFSQQLEHNVPEGETAVALEVNYDGSVYRYKITKEEGQTVYVSFGRKRIGIFGRKRVPLNLYPQTGKWKGFKGETEAGFPLDKNIEDSQIWRYAVVKAKQ